VFTGIVEELGEVVDLRKGEAGARLTIRCSTVLADARVGDSIAVNGTCLTVVAIADDQWSADVSPETLARTNLGRIFPGAAVNLERPLRLGGRLDGHFVLGHVDGVAEVVALDGLGEENWWLQIRVPAGLQSYIVSKASVAVDGISLTVANVTDDIVSFAIIPRTYKHTTVHDRHAGSWVNLEVDILAKHVEKLLTNLPKSK